MKITPRRLWITIFCLWGGFLLGLVGAPGLIQLVRLKSLLDSKQKQISQLQAEVDQLQAQSTELEKSKVAQLREIRKVLGYAAEDELIFEF